VYELKKNCVIYAKVSRQKVISKEKYESRKKLDFARKKEKN
jgi:hypothetical protein